MKSYKKTWIIKFMILIIISLSVLPISTVKAKSNIKVVKAAVGGAFIIYLKSDGTVWGSGTNDKGQLAQSPSKKKGSNIPIKIEGLDEIIDIEAGQGHCLALKKDGTVWAWGDNEYGQLGYGKAGGDDWAITQVSGLSDITKISTRSNHNLALTKAGEVFSWGENGYYQVGTGSNSPSKISTPIKINNLSDVKDIQATGSFSFVVKNDGTAWGWGLNNQGQLGDGTTYTRAKPTYISGLNNIKKLVCGHTFTIVLKDDGTIWVTGRNSEGQFGDGTTVNSRKFKKVTDIDDAVDIFVGDFQTYVIRSNGEVWSWGKNDNGLVGHDFEKYSYEVASPAPIEGLKNIKSISSNSINAVAVSNDGLVYGMGLNDEGELGLGYESTVKKPVEITGVGNIKDISIGIYSLLVNDKGEVWQLGFDSGRFSAYYEGEGFQKKKDLYKIDPKMKIEELSNIKEVKVGYMFNLALGEDGTVWSWGLNTNGQLGDGTYTKRTMPTQIQNLTDVVAIAAGEKHSVALKADGTVWMWGYDYYTVNKQTTPIKVEGLEDIVSIVAERGDYTLGLKKDGTVWSWGGSSWGQLGNSGDGTPSKVEGVDDVVQIAASSRTSYALKRDGTIWAWGFNYYYNLGNGSFGNTSKPKQVTGMYDVKAITASDVNGMALKNDGTLWGWGYNDYGQLLQDNADVKTAPYAMKAKDVKDIKYIKSGEESHMIIKEDGTLWGWGWNNRSALGIQNLVYSKPIVIEAVSPSNKNPSDVDLDGTVTINDLALIALNYNVTEKDINWNLIYDLNEDGIVDLYDLTIISRELNL